MRWEVDTGEFHEAHRPASRAYTEAKTKETLSQTRWMMRTDTSGYDLTSLRGLWCIHIPSPTARVRHTK